MITSTILTLLKYQLRMYWWKSAIYLNFNVKITFKQVRRQWNIYSDYRNRDYITKGYSEANEPSRLFSWLNKSGPKDAVGWQPKSLKLFALKFNCWILVCSKWVLHWSQSYFYLANFWDVTPENAYYEQQREGQSKKKIGNIIKRGWTKPGNELASVDSLITCCYLC